MNTALLPPNIQSILGMCGEENASFNAKQGIFQMVLIESFLMGIF